MSARLVTVEWAGGSELLVTEILSVGASQEWGSRSLGYGLVWVIGYTPERHRRFACRALEGGRSSAESNAST